MQLGSPKNGVTDKFRGVIFLLKTSDKCTFSRFIHYEEAEIEEERSGLKQNKIKRKEGVSI